MKKLTKFLCVSSMLFCTALTVTACTAPTPQDSISSPSSSENIVKPSVTLNETTLALDLYESKTLTATTENYDGAVVWNSSDEQVVTVSNGVVTAFKTGMATITATAGEVKATCSVTVAQGAQQPTFTNLAESVSIIKGTKDTLDISLSYKGQPFTLASVEYSTEGNVLTITQDGEITALTYGTQNVTVKAYVGETLVAQKTVEVSVIEYGSIVVELEENILNLSVGDEGYDLSQLSVLINGVEVENPQFTGTSNNESVAKIQEGKIIGLNRGEAVITITYTSEANNVYDTNISVIVTKNMITKEVGFLVRGNGASTSVQTGVANIDLTSTGIDVSAITKVLCGQNEITFSAIENTLTLTDAPAGEQVYTLITPTVDYTIDGCIYTNEISTKADFLAWRKNAKTILGYTVLTADIRLQGEVLLNLDNIVNGILDGRGHTISDFVLKNTSLANDVSATGGFKNIQFINFVQDCSQSTDHMTFGIIAKMMYGSVENVVLKGRIEGLVADKHHYGVLSYGGNETSTIRNVVGEIFVTGDVQQAYFLFGVNWAVSPNVIENVYVVTNTYNMSYTNVPAKGAEVYLTEEQLLAKIDFTAWKKPWTVEDNAVPYMSDYSAFINQPFVAVDGNPWAGETLTLKSTCYLPLTYTLKNTVNGVSLDGNVLTIAQTVTVGTEIVVEVTSANLATLTKTIQIVVELPTMETQYVFLAKGDAAITATNTGNATLDVSQTTMDLTNLSQVLCNGENVTFGINGNVVTLTNAPAGEHTYTFVTSTKKYTAKICVYGYSISNKAEFLAWRNSTEDIRAYTILTADIDLAGESFAVANRDLSCILDGRGHTVANFTLPKTSLFTNVTVLGGYKNIQLVNVTQTWDGTDGGWGILAKMLYGSAENVFIKGNIIGLGTTLHSGVLFYGGSDTTSVKNIIAEITTDGTGTYFVGGVNWSVAPATLDNIHVAINATSAMTYGAATATNSGIYSSTADLANATKDFGEPWIVQSGKVPYLSDYSAYITND